MSRFSEILRRARAALGGNSSQHRSSEGEQPPLGTSLGDRPSSISPDTLRRLTGNPPGDDDEDEAELSRLDASYRDRDWSAIQAAEVRVVSSSNVYSYAFELASRDSGTLFVTFLNWEPGMKPEDRSGPGATYAYYDFPFAKFKQFGEMAATTAGGAVWEYCRVRHAVHEHQHRYRLIQVAGDYVPRKVTARGFKARTLVPPGMSPSSRKKLYRRAWKSPVSHIPSRKFFKRSTLSNKSFSDETIARNVNRAGPNRGTPNRGSP